MNSEDKDVLIGLSAFLSALLAVGALVVAGCKHFPDPVPPSPTPPQTEIVLDYRFGGFHGEASLEDPAAQIASLAVSANGMAYAWTSGGCEALGAKDRTDASATLACIFYRDGDRYVGGKFDWISTSRTTRDFHNIDTAYHGWNADAFHAAKEYAFCIVSKDGRRRTNIITYSK